MGGGGSGVKRNIVMSVVVGCCEFWASDDINWILLLKRADAKRWALGRGELCIMYSVVPTCFN